LVSFLTGDECSFLSVLLGGGQVPANSEIMVEAINTKAISAIDDNVIDFVDGAPCVNDFYFDDLKTSLGGICV